MRVIEQLRAPTLGFSAEDLHATIARALAEDLGAGDVTARLTISENQRALGRFYAQQELVVAGLFLADEIFRTLDGSCEFRAVAKDGAAVRADELLAEVRGPARALVSGERVSLNFLQHLSGIATLTRRFARELEGLKAELLDTRKTTPGLRALEKYAVRMGGGRNHRQRLDDGILIKNNHIVLAGGVRAAVALAKQDRTHGLPIEVEVRNPSELDEAIVAGADAALLDNMAPEAVRECVQAARGRLRLEASGGVRLENIRAYAESGVDTISVGALTHSAPAVAIHFLLQAL